ncbi:MAG: GTPase HflX [Candidatus Thorarchaeota archaeon]|nr:GTPase HflX [Candidatus Thorarchaeota archaeon]
MTSQTALLVQLRRSFDPNLLDEFTALAESAGYTVLDTFDIIGYPSTRYAISSGKVEEIKTWLEINEPDVVLFSPFLKSSQMYRLMETWDVEVRDRTQIILEIFDRQARTLQAKLQIDEARLQYELPFIRHQLRMRLQKEHTGARPVGEQIGAGEDLLNLRVMEIRRRIANIRAKLEKISQAQELKRKRRSAEGFLEVALAGYTNAGKSTLHRALTGSTVEVADQLFTTLSTKAATMTALDRRVILNDSVGFISDLPSSLLKAFNTTLMEIGGADVIVVVIDGSDSLDEILRKTNTCLDTFREIGVNGIPMIAALNKIDRIDNSELPARIDAVSELVGEVVPISAKTGENLDALLDAVEMHLPQLSRYSLSLPYGDESMSLLSWIHDNGLVYSEKYEEDTIKIEADLPEDAAQRLFKTLPVGSLHRLE